MYHEGIKANREVLYVLGLGRQVLKLSCSTAVVAACSSHLSFTQALNKNKLQISECHFSNLGDGADEALLSTFTKCKNDLMK